MRCGLHHVAWLVALRHPEVRASWRASKDELFSTCGPSFETPRKGAAPQDDGAVVVSKEVEWKKTALAPCHRYPPHVTLPRRASVHKPDRVWLPRQYRHDAKPVSQHRACSHRRAINRATRRSCLRSNRRRPPRHIFLHGRTLLIFASWCLPLHEIRRPACRVG
jgi:hypothetical protein